MSRTGTSLLTKTPVNRHRYGNLNEVVVPVITAKTAGRNEIATGDIVILPVAANTFNTTATPGTAVTVGTVLPASGIQSLLQGLASAADCFLGVAMDSSANGDSDDIMVATSGVFEFNCASATYTVGQAACMASGLDEAGYVSGTYIVSGVGGTVVGAWSDANRIGTIVGKGTTKTSVLVDIKSRIFSGPA